MNNICPENGHSWSSHALKNTLKFPVYAYKKENGFLALITYNHKEDDIMFCSKSTNQGEFVNYIKDTFYTTLNIIQRELITDYCKNNNCTMIFECIRPIEDPHIIKYDKNELILLDIVTNSFEPKFVEYNELQEIGMRFGLKYKQQELAFVDFDSLHDFKKRISDQWDCKHEGYVLEDSNGFKVKLKSKYYGWWKQWRSVKEKLQKGQNIKKVYTNEFDVKVYKLLLSHTPEELQNMSIIDVADEFYKHIDI